MQDIREIEFRDSGSNKQQDVFRGLSHCSTSRLHTEGFSLYVYTGPSTKGPSPRNYNSILGVHYSSHKYNHLYTRERRHKAKPQSPLHKRDRHKAKPHSPLHKRDRHKAEAKKNYNLGDPMIINNTW